MKEELQELSSKFQELLLDIRGIILYDFLGKKPEDHIPRYVVLPQSLNLRIEKNKVGYSVYSDEYIGLITFANTKDELEDMVNDAVFTYFSIPRDIAKRISNMYTCKEFSDTKSKFSLAIA
ncbi:MAG: hypothetical protein M3Q81_04275 [bacterium]|nr:hypothetical protein [bacterium]